MIDIKTLVIRDILPITSAELAQGLSPLSIILTGENLNEASTVLINDREAPEFIVVSPSRLIAQVPDTETKSVLRKVAVLADRPSMKRSSLLHFEVGKGIKGLRGIERLVQLFCKLLLQTPGSDKFEPGKGGGLLAVVGRNISRNDSKSIQAAVVGAVGRTKEQILAAQAKNSRTPADERLLTAKLEAVGYDPHTTTISARVILSAVSGREAVANVTF